MPRAARRDLRRHMSRAGAVPRLHFDHDAVPWKLCRHLGLRPVDEVGADTEEERDAEQRGEHGERGPHGGGSELRFVWWWCRRRRRQAHPLRRRCCKVLAAHGGEGNALPATFRPAPVRYCSLLTGPNISKIVWTTGGMPASRSSSPTKQAPVAAADGAAQQENAPQSDRNVELQGLREELTNKHTAKVRERHPRHKCCPAVCHTALSPRALATSDHSGDRDAQRRAAGHDGRAEGGARGDTRRGGGGAAGGARRAQGGARDRAGAGTGRLVTC